MFKLIRYRLLVSAIALSFLFSFGMTEAQEEDDILKILDSSTDKSASEAEEVADVKDIFKPILRERDEAKGEDEILVEPEEELTGMQLYEPADLLLVGVISSGSTRRAMVQDKKNKGYTLKEGDLIGRRGVVTKIEHDRVIIIETTKTRSGKIDKKTITMQLNTQGEF